jgi:hypothetical protein
MTLTAFPNGASSFGVPMVGGVPFGPNSVAWFVDPQNGVDGNDGQSPTTAFATLYRAQYAAAAGRNDVVFLLGTMSASSSTAGTARLSLANAVSAAAIVGATVPTDGVLTWAKNGVHLIGVAAPSQNSRARIAPPSGTYTAATFGSANFVTVSATGCIFANISVYQGFSTGTTAQICWTDTGGRNVYENCEFLGMNDAASAQNASSRSVKISGSGESVFVNCQIGGDTTTRTVANASLELAGGTTRNKFVDCIFPFHTSNAGVLGILGTGANCVDRWNLFDRCTFFNALDSSSTGMTALASFTSAAPNGTLVFKDCASYGITKFGDANALANSVIDMAAVSAAAGGLMVNPS